MHINGIRLVPVHAHGLNSARGEKKLNYMMRMCLGEILSLFAFCKECNEKLNADRLRPEDLTKSLSYKVRKSLRLSHSKGISTGQIL